MRSFTFDSERILKSAIRSADDHVLRYTTSTVKQGLARHRTIFEDASGLVGATIDWRERTFDIAGETHNIDNLKRKLSNFSGTRYWKWPGGEEYKVRYSNTENTWTVTASTGEIVAELTSCIARPFRSSILPVLRIARGIRAADQRRFLSLLLIYSETKRLDRQD
ncbi:hypothetical protein C8R44DRAFT_885188 [Mycena epipterygia]|nr:hypothetical protein C8R44DRAFT_885188 [Mycena epipterygia]